jgi:hypothetical protein
MPSTCASTLDGLTVMSSFIHSTGIYYFTKGFLFTRLVFDEHSDILHTNSLQNSFIGLVVLGVLGSFHFFRTGHRATLSSI